MKVTLSEKGFVLIREETDSAEELLTWISDHDGHVFVLTSTEGENCWLQDLGLRDEVCHEPINVVSAAADEQIRLISNFAFTPFFLKGKNYASIEGFWQGLKFSEEADRERLAALHGGEAKTEGSKAPKSESFIYDGQTILRGTPKHWSLMYAACWAKFSRHLEAKQALLSTGTRPLIHKVPRDSRTIPGIVMADIWMRIRKRLSS